MLWKLCCALGWHRWIFGAYFRDGWRVRYCPHCERHDWVKK